MKISKRRRAAARKWVADRRDINPFLGSDLLDDIDELLAVARRLRKQLNESYPLPLARPKWLKDLLSESAFLDSEDC